MLWPIVLNDGVTFQVQWCGASDGVLWIKGLDISLLEASAVFSDVNKTSRIIAYGNIEHEGYIKLIHLSLQEGLVKVALHKGG